ncbi:hypothetical protein ACFVWR_10535 [Leifsonia sp. NPDC058292]|uniref:hypothetical protein n=1 Tax=Leifsonia sp. NPDC058292 TaxID=3346428 RepID=UPI0036DCD178
MTRAFSDAQREYLTAAEACEGSAGGLLATLRRLDPAALAPLPGSGRTAERFRFLATVAQADVTAARVLEPHLDAVAILTEAGQRADAGHVWGVFAAEAPGTKLEASEDAQSPGVWRLTGVKPWCSLGGRLSDALLTATTGSGARRLFRADLTQAGVHPEPSAWVARGLADVESGPLRFEAAVAEPVGEEGWYLERPGFRHGAIGVAACWWGGCVPLFDALATKAAREGTSPLATSRVGHLHRVLEAARLVLAHSAERIDATGEGGIDDDAAAVLAHTARGAVADAVEETLSAARDILGPASLGFDESVARRCADLELYVSQYHRGPDDASLFGHLPQGGLGW